jgi:hypothetical protein
MGIDMAQFFASMRRFRIRKAAGGVFNVRKKRV